MFLFLIASPSTAAPITKAPSRFSPERLQIIKNVIEVTASRYEVARAAYLDSLKNIFKTDDGVVFTAKYAPDMQFATVLADIFENFHKIQIIPGGKYCQENSSVAAYVTHDESPRKIRLCDIYFTQPDELKVQIISHELAHAFGVRDECDASTVEMIMFRLTNGMGSYHYTGYTEGCESRIVEFFEKSKF